MRIHLITATNRQPAWVQTAYDEYARRLRGNVTLELRELPLARRTRTTTVQKAANDEAERMLSLIPKSSYVVALAETGKSWTTAQLADQLSFWMGLGQPVSLLVGGPDGLGRPCIERAQMHWSISPLTLPHGLVRVMVAEALYRAWSLLEGHPYHRA